MSTFRLGMELIRYRPVVWGVSFVCWTVIHAMPIMFGLLVGSVFERLADGPPAANAWTPAIVFAVLAIGRNLIFWVGDLYWIRYWNEQVLQIRRNLLGWLLRAPGARAVTASPGQAISTFRDDVEDLVEWVENLVDSGGIVFFTLGSLGVMFWIDAGLAALVLIPLVLTVVLTQALSPQIRARRREMRAATEDVTGFVGEAFAAVSAIKLADATEPVLDHFDTINEVRRRAAMRDTLLTELLRSINTNMAVVGTGLVLVVGASAISRGAFSVGDLAVFLTYLPRLTSYMAFTGDIIAQYRRTGVAYERIRSLSVDAPDEVLLDRTRVPLTGMVEAPVGWTAHPEPFRSLEVSKLSYMHPDGAPGVEDVSFRIEAGEFVVFTGKIGSGKSSLLRAVLGLVPAEGTWRWNGQEIDDPATFLVPPRTAYTSQVPRLFSDSLANNISLGRQLSPDRMGDAVSLAVLDSDLVRLERGLDTAIGARGVKLSGGQVQRSAAARMFATEAQLLVFDDLSSALDVHTEAQLWARLFGRRDVTCLVVSHRRSVLERADRVILLDAGRIADQGPLTDLLARSRLMGELWVSAA